MKQIQKAFAIVLAISALFSVRADENPMVQKDLAQLQGEWVMISGNADGQPMPSEMLGQMKRVCKNDEVTVTMGDEIYLKAKFTIDPSRKPKTIDYSMTGGFTKGKKQLGIYELDGDTFRACFGSPGSERPADFTSTTGEKRTLSVWKRKKESIPKQEQK